MRQLSNRWVTVDLKPGLFVCKYNSVFILNYNSMFMGYKVVKWCMSLNICSHHWFAVGVKQSSSATCCCTCECTLYSEVFITINKCWYHTWCCFSFSTFVLYVSTCVTWSWLRPGGQRLERDQSDDGDTGRKKRTFRIFLVSMYVIINHAVAEAALQWK